MDFPIITPSLQNTKFPSTGDQDFCFKDYLGQLLVLYFYPKDATPGCTTEGQQFSKYYVEFQQINTAIFGVSRDTLAQHQRFKSKRAFPFDLISDEQETLCQAFDVIKQKNFLGKSYMGIERSTFLINKAGSVVYAWRQVKVAKHVESVLQQAQALAQGNL